MYLKLKIKFLLNFIISYVYCIDLLMWSPIKFDFLFYDFFLFTMIFQRFIQNKHKKRKTTRKNHPGRSYVRFHEFEEAKYPVFEFNVKT